MSGTVPMLRDLAREPIDAIGSSEVPIVVAVRRLEAPLAALSFWVAVAFPAVYVVLFASGGFESVSGVRLLLALVGLHVLALVAGRQHEPGRGNSVATAAGLGSRLRRDRHHQDGVSGQQ